MSEELWEKFENNMLNEAVSNNRLKKLKQMFSTCDRGLSNGIGKASREDIEEFLNKLNRDEFVKLDGKKYSGSTKADIKKFLKQFFKWFKGDNEFYPKEVSWIKARIRKDELPKDKPAISIDEARALSKSFKNVDYQILTLLLFDSGFRIQEMLSVKKKDLSFEEFKRGQKCYWIRCNESKTEKRKIPIPLFSSEIEDYLGLAKVKRLNGDSLLFNVSYDYFRNCLKRTSKLVLGKGLTPHCLRHSSATYYAREYDGNMNLIATRYGWSFSSVELKTYIKRSGAYQKAGASKVYENQVEELKHKLRVQEENHQKEMDAINQKFDWVMKALKGEVRSSFLE